jgi:hypothetical protein
VSLRLSAGVKFMFLVGGFSESPMLQMEIRSEFKHLVKIIIPVEVSLAILKGTVDPICDFLSDFGDMFASQID